MKPLKAKVFSYYTLSISPPCEIQINTWLEENPGIEVVHLIQSESMAVKNDRLERNMTITILYCDA